MTKSVRAGAGGEARPSRFSLEELQAAHIILLRAILQEPDPKHADGISGSFAATLKRRMPELYKEQIGDLVAQLNDFRITNPSSLDSGMSAGGAQDLRGTTFPIQRSKPRHRSLGGRRGAVADRLHLLPCSATICPGRRPEESGTYGSHEGSS